MGAVGFAAAAPEFVNTRCELETDPSAGFLAHGVGPLALPAAESVGGRSPSAVGERGHPARFAVPWTPSALRRAVVWAAGDTAGVPGPFASVRRERSGPSVT